MVTTYRKNPVEIQAIEWKGNNEEEINKFIPEHVFLIEGNVVVIATLDGHIKANIGDFIIKGVKGEFYPCKPDIFYMTYERV